MIRRGFIIAVVLAVIAAIPDAQETCNSSPLLVRNTNVWTSSGLLRNRDMLFRDGRVAAIDEARTTPAGNIDTIDGTGHTLLPGFVDAHLHLIVPGGLPPADRPRAVEDIAGRQLLRSGVTSGRLHLATVDDAVRMKARSADPCSAMPRLQVGGPGLSGAVDRDAGNFQGARSREHAEQKIESFRAAGIDWVAIHDADKFAPGVLEAIAAAARNAGIRLMAAGTTPPEIAAALTIRPDTLDYFDRTPAPEYAEQILASIRAQADLVLVPTPGVPYRTVMYARNPALLDRLEGFDFLAPSDRAFVIANAKKHLAGAEAARSEGVMQSLPAKFRQLRQLGRPMAMGSDAGSPLHFPADAIWWELEAWRSLGVSHRDSLMAATANGARVLRAEDTGRLTVGSRADFILYRGDAENGPFDVARIVAVGKGGVRFVIDGRWVGPTAP
jgi:imidazolonepropionase-like amidohydrolase